MWISQVASFAISLIPELSRLINLRTLDVASNALEGTLPFWLNGLVSLTSFSASNNQFSGPVYDFAPLVSLSYLDLSSNVLTGSLPPTLLAGVPANEKLVVDLSRNKLDGRVPAELARMTRLSIQLQDNRISEIDQELCKTDGLNDFDVLSFGCDGILCPVGTWNPLGRQSNEDMPCQPCNKAKFMGATNCGKSSATTVASTIGLLLGAAFTWVLLL
jgi:hypothetical protein